MRLIKGEEKLKTKLVQLFFLSFFTCNATIARDGAYLSLDPVDVGPARREREKEKEGGASTPRLTFAFEEQQSGVCATQRRVTSSSSRPDYLVYFFFFLASSYDSIEVL